MSQVEQGEQQGEVKSEHQHHEHAHQPVHAHAVEQPKTVKIQISKNMIRVGVVVLVLLVLSPVIAAPIDLYYAGWHNPTLLKVATKLQLPAVKVDGETYSIEAYNRELENLESILKRSDATKSVTRAELQKMFLDRVVRAAAVKRLVDEKQIDTAASIKLAKALTFNTMTDEEIEKAVTENFHWSMDYFNSHVLYPFAGEMAYALDVLKPQADAIAALVKAPKADFAKIAKEKGEDATKEKGGDLGFFKRGAMVPEFEDQVFAMKKGEVAGPFMSRFGWHVVKVTDIKGKDADMEVRASHIIVNLQSHKDDIEPRIVEVQKDVKVSVWVKE